MELKDIDGSRFLYDPKSTDLVKILKDKLPEFNKYEGNISAKKVFQFIILMYDASSPLAREIQDYYLRKSTCAEVVGFPKSKGTWTKESESILIGTDATVNDMIVAFISLFGMIEMYQLVGYLSILSSETRKAIDYRGDKNSISIINDTGSKIQDLQRVVFKSGEYDEISFVRKALYSRLEKERLKIRPEEIVRHITKEGGLPSDYNPYEDDYKVEQSKFIGDEEPK